MGDPDRWLDDHGDYLFRYARRRLLSGELAEDAVQETFLAALKAQERFAGNSSERTWLTGILKHKIVDIMRHQYREVTAPDNGYSDNPNDWEALFNQSGHWLETFRDWRNPAPEFEKTRIREALDECFSQLKPTLATVFSLKELAGRSGDDTCKPLEITTTTAWVMLHRAGLFLRTCLEMRI